MPNTLVDLVKITATSTGTGAITLGGAVSGYRGVEALLVGAAYSCSIQQDSQWEFGQYTLLGNPYRLARTVFASSNGGAPISLLPGAAIAFVALSSDLDQVPQPFGFGPPNANLGDIGDFYYDLTNLVIYGPKTSTGWGQGYSLVGPSGPALATFTTLAAFKAAPIGNKFQALADPSYPFATYFWRGGDYSGTSTVALTALAVIPADGTPLSSGAWVRRKDRETISITDLGGVDDWTGAAGTNNFAALEAAYALRPVTIRLPKFGTGIYMVNGVTAVSDAAGVTLDPEPGVSISVQGASSIAVTDIKGQRSTRLLKTDYAALRYQRRLGPPMRLNVAEMGRPASALGAQLQTPVKLDFADATHWQVSWPNGSFTPATPTSVSGNTVNWGAVASGVFDATVFHVVPGDYLAALVTDATTYFPAITVFTDSGWVLIYQNKTGDYSTLTYAEKIGSAATAQKDSVNQVAAQTTYRFTKSMLGIRVCDQHSFELVLNGTAVRRYRTSGNIQRAGWAGGFGAGGANFIIQSPVRFKGKKSLGIKPLKIVSLGDSTGDETVTGQSQFDFARQYLAGVGGCQVDTLTNLAHSGDTSAAQKAALGGIVFAGTGYDYCLIQIGINDIQTSVPVATFVQNVLECINYCRAGGCEPIVGIPAMFYSQTDAQAYNQDGGATQHSADGSSHRLELMRMLSDNRVYCNTVSFEDMGAVVASLLPMKTSPWGDQVVYDNIHPTTWGAMLLGYGWAKAIAAHITSAQEDFPAEAIPLPVDYFASGIGTSATPQYTLNEQMCEWGYYVSTNGTAISDGTTVFTLPRRLRPRADKIVTLRNFGAAIAPMSTVAGYWTVSSATGAVKAYGVDPAAQFLSFSETWKV